MSKYLYTILLCIVVFIGSLFVYQRYELLKYKSLYSKELQNVKAYRIANSGLEGSIIQYQMTVNDLRASRDSIDRKLSEAIDKIKVKDSKVEYLQYQATVASRKDTIKFIDTLFVSNIHVDTLIHDDWYKLQLELKYPSEVIVSPTFRSEKYIVINSKKEYNGKPSWFFFVRWFQKKHTIIEVNIEEKSPYIINKENKFIKILK